MNKISSKGDIAFPHYVILKASAGAGKTRALTNRYVQFLLSERIPNNKLKNILAVTFSNNAAREMKERILNILKRLYQKDEKTIKEFSTLLSLQPDEISLKAEKAIEEILNNYSDFQVKTIDSFMTTLFKASSTDFGYTPDFEIAMNNEETLVYAFELFMRDMRDGSKELNNLIDVVELISDMKGDDSTYLWDPASTMLRTLREFYSIESATLKEFAFERDLLKNKEEVEKTLNFLMKDILSHVKNSGLIRSGNCKIYDEFPEIIEKENFQALINKGIKNLPVNKPTKKEETKLIQYEYIKELWKKFQKIVSEYAFLYSQIYYLPYQGIFEDFKERLNRIKLREGKVFIEDITRMIASHLNFMVPDIYFRLSEKIYHFLIDEFQDTSPLQWQNLISLIENALSISGSLFVVGDTKQAIYSFRNADYKIMKELEKSEIFPSAEKIISELDTNYRSGGRIVEFNEEIFKKRLPLNETYRDATRSGLMDFKQKPLDEKKDQGYIELKAFSPFGETNNIETENQTEEELKSYLLDIIKDLRERGYSYSDIAVVGYQNKFITKISQWINENNIEILSYSSLDVRKRKVSDELLCLLKFLDSPLDDFSFSVFLKGKVYSNYLNLLELSALRLQPDTERQSDSATVRQATIGLQPNIDQFLLKYRDSKGPLYKAFEEEYPDIWQRDFSELFKLTGYLPLYDLLSMAISRYNVFETIPEEEATFIKFLELAIYFEGKGYSSIKDFVEFFSGAGEDEKLWNISMPAEADAIKLMTVHKAKGLEFPAVIFYMHETKPRPKGYYKKEDERSFCVVKINDKIAEKSETLKNIKDEDSLGSKIDRLNTLYVALTRAENELYVLAPLEKRNVAPVELIFSDCKTDSMSGNSASYFASHGDKPCIDEVERLKNRKERISPEKINIIHSLMKSEFIVEEGEIHIEEKQRGEFIHKVLSYVEYLESYSLLPHKIKEWIDRLNLETTRDISYDEIDAIMKKLFNSQLKEYFIPITGRVIRNEVEFTDSAGRLFRMDRLVVDRDSVTVIDYKTGRFEKKEDIKHKEQVRHYKSILSEIYRDKSIRGFIYYVDIDKVVEV